MSYIVLARKWRPKTFNEVVGQEHVIRALANALEQQRLHHAYLFTGTRGVGKTTIARILAKCFNCETGITATPCGKCDTCLEIDSGRFLDLLEVDAASRTRVEDTKDLLDNVQYLPAKGRFKVYLIDEVHMLSGHSFNALLKTLEEPPEHVKFLLATTDPQKLPITVLSRCLQFNLKAVNPETIQKQLAQILSQEQTAYEDAALQQLALSAKGSVRDALSLLDQALAFGKGKVISSEVAAMLGTVEQTKLINLITALVNNDATKLLTTIAELAELATDFSDILDEILKLLHQIALLQIVPTVATTNWSNVEILKQFATQISPEETQLYYQIGLKGKADLLLAPSARVGFEMIMLRMLAFRPDQSFPKIVSHDSEASNQTTINTLKQNATSKIAQPAPIHEVAPHKQQERKHQQVQTPIPAESNDILGKIKVTGPTKALLNHCIIKTSTATQIDLLLDPSQAPLLNKKHEERLSQAFSDYLQRPILVTITIGTANMPTIATNSKQDSEQKKAAAIKHISADQQLNEILNKFDATIIPDSIQFQEN